CGLPELVRCRSGGKRKSLPGFDKNIVEQQHGHIATQTVTLLGQGMKQLDHRLLCSYVPVIELHGVRPRSEIRVFSMGKPEDAGAGLLRKRLRCLGRALHEQLGLQTEPGMIDAKMIWNKIQNQFHSVVVKSASK